MICPECGAEFIKTVHNKIYCTLRCGGLASQRRYERTRTRDYSAYMKAWRKKNKEEGLCPRCGRNPSPQGLSVCDECRDYIKLNK